MDADTLSIAELLSQLELSVARTFKTASPSRDDILSAEARLQVIGQAMRRYLNTLSPIHRLPPEMLSTIFEEVVDSCVKPLVPEEWNSGEGRAYYATSQFRLAHVCQVWRSVALSDASLWSHVDVGYREAAVKFFLQCSSGYPLTLYTPAEKASLLASILKDHGTRVRTIYVNRNGKEDNMAARAAYYPLYHFHAPMANQQFYPIRQPRFDSRASGDMKDVLGPMDLSSSAPNLECLMLRGHGAGLARLFGNSYPPIFESPLKALALILSESYFPTNPFPNLTHLRLSFPLPGYNAQRFTKSLSQLLSNAPRLQFLRLSDLCTNSISVEDFTRRLSKVSLKQLRLLEFSDVQLQMVFYLLRHLTIPKSVLLSIQEDGRRTGIRSNNHPLLLHLPHIAPLKAATFMEIQVRVDARALLLTGHDATRTSGVLLKACSIDGVSWTTEWLPELPSMMSLAQITVLHIDDSSGRVLPSLLPYFTELQELSIVLLHETAAERAGMAETAPALLFASLTPSETLVCPALRFLGLEADIGHDSFPDAELHAMAIGRFEWGCGIRRFVYHWHYDSESLPVSLTSGPTAGTDSQWDILQNFEAYLAALLQPYVDSIECRLTSESRERLCPFDTPDCWRVPGAEKYWRCLKSPGY